MSLAPPCSPSPRAGLSGKRLVLGLTGGIACYKSAELVRLLVKAGAQVQVVMSDSAQRFVAPLTFQALSGRPVLTSAWDDANPVSHDNGMPHINLTRNADAILIAPASADAIAALAQGRAADLISLLCLARPYAAASQESDGAVRCPLLLAPAMNREMWAHPATQRNVSVVVQDGATLLGPGRGDQACGEVGDGRMLEPEEILQELEACFQPKVLQGHRVLITAGPTFEAIDPVRGITNRSSGKMGFAIARAAREAGAEVTLVAGPVHLPTPRGVDRIDVESAQQMLEATLPHAATHDVFIATAAVADWRPARLSEHKIKKDGKKLAPSFELTENADILAAVAALPVAPFCVGFAAESEHLARHARAKLERKRVQMIVGNLGPATFGRDDNALLLVDDQGDRPLPQDGQPTDKLTLARALVADIAHRIARPPA